MMTDEQRVAERLKNKQRMAEKRANMNDEEKEKVKEKDRLRKRKEYTKVKEQIYLENERELNKAYKIKMRNSRSEEQIEFDKLEYVIRKRDFRKKLTDDRLVLEKEKSKAGMAEFRSKGRMLDYNPKQVRELDESVLWTIFSQKGPKYQALLHKLKPDIELKIIGNDGDAQASNSKEDLEKRDADMSKWYEDELKDVNEAEDEAEDDEDEPEKSEYEKIRDRNIEELELAKKASGLFND